MSQFQPQRCYIDGGDCTCQAFDVASECPKDVEFEDDLFDDEDSIHPEIAYERSMSNQSAILDDLSDDFHLRICK